MKSRVVVASLIVLALVSSVFVRDARADASVYVDSATEGWTSSGISLEAGQTATIYASGSALCNALIRDICITDPNGAQPAWETFVLPGWPAYSLIASVGGGGPIFVGTGPFEVTGPGELFLAYNDEYYPDNIGGFTADITVHRIPGDGTGGSDDGQNDDGQDDGVNPDDVHQPSDYAAVVLSPIDTGGESVFKSNRGNVPVKFALLKDGTETCALPPATIAVTRVSGENVGPISPEVFSSSSDSGTSYRVTNGGCQYHYNLRAANLGPGVYEVAILIDGQQVGGAFFTLK